MVNMPEPPWPRAMARARRAMEKMALAAAIAAALAAAPRAEERGRETNFPIPRFVSMKATVGNVRRGPNKSHRIDWVFTQKGLPLQIVDEYGHWRLVRDMEGDGGWMHYALLSGVRTVMVTGSRVPLRVSPREGARPVAYAEHGVIARLDMCEGSWCRLSAQGHRGWARKSEIWGVEEDEAQSRSR